MKILRTAGLLLFGIIAGATSYAFGPTLLLQTSASDPPLNFIAVSDRIHTSGQPSIAQLGGLKKAGYDLVINLAPPQTIGSIADEGKLVAQMGLRYVNIPVDWDSPRLEDFEFFSSILKNSNATRVLVHCQANMRASVFTFLYRAIQDGIEPDEAYDSVRSLWVPKPQWINFSKLVLAKHKVVFASF